MSNEDNQPVFAIVMKYRGQERITELPLGQEAVGQLAIEAEFRELKIGELVARMIIAITENDQFGALLEPQNSEAAEKSANGGTVPSG